MRVCLICEGSYPYTAGGVSSWVQQIIKLFPEYEFAIYAIVADRSQEGQYKYKLPENLKLIQEVFLNDAYNDESSKYKKPKSLKKWQREEFPKFMMGEVERWDSIFDFFIRENHQASSFLMSEDFFNITQGIYENYFDDSKYSDYLWTTRSMYLTLFHILNNPPQKADIYHAVSTGYAGIAGALGKRCWGGRFLLTEHGIYTREREEEIIKAEWVSPAFKSLWINYFKNLSKGAYFYSDRVLALFETNNFLQMEMGADPAKCDYTPNGINLKSFANLPQKTEEEVFNVGAVIRVSPIKDIKSMLSAFDFVKQKLPNAHFYIMGPTDEAPEYYQECLDLLEDLGTKDVIFTGRVRVREYLGKMDVIVLTSLSEAQPLALMEAMAAGKPCVSTNVGCVKELFEGGRGDDLGRCGLMAPIMNYEKIAEHIITIVTDVELANKYGETGKKRIQKYYTEEKFQQAYKELYQEMGEMNFIWRA